MNRALRTVLNVACGVWLGGLLMLFLAVNSLFRTFADQRDKAGLAASDLFGQFNHLRLLLAGIALLTAFLWWYRQRSPSLMTVFMLLALAGAAAVYTAGILTPHIEQLRMDGLTHSPEFRKLHGLSMAGYLAETVLVFAACLTLPDGAKTANRLTA